MQEEWVENPNMMVAHGIEPLWVAEGPLVGPMVRLTIHHADLMDVVNSFGPEPPGPDHHIDNEKEVTVMIAYASAHKLLHALAQAISDMHELSARKLAGEEF